MFATYAWSSWEKDFLRDEKPSGAKANWHYEQDTGIKGARIVLRARKMVGPFVVQGSGAHKAQEARGTENAEAWIEIPLRTVAERKR